VSYSVAYRCVGCGAAGSDAIFNESSIRAGCPYDRSANNDLLACKQRTLRRGSEVLVDHWEAWILDPRDCQPYRIVYLRDGRWWFAQNLNYQKELTFATTTAAAGVTGQYTCPSGDSFFTGLSDKSDNNTIAAGTAQSCKTYGALYSWHTAMALNGRTAGATSVPLGQKSNVQGICPDGWFLPSDFDWGAAFNAMEDSCSAPFDVVDGAAPCNHINSVAGNFASGSLRLVANARATVSCPPTLRLESSHCAKPDRPAWTWVRKDYESKITTPLALATDKYGFSALPAGFLNSNIYYRLGGLSLWWEATEHNAVQSYVRTISGYSVSARSYDFAYRMLSVRCVR
jgi:uncharacterized protein (TIGR02145 family)